MLTTSIDYRNAAHQSRHYILHEETAMVQQSEVLARHIGIVAAPIHARLLPDASANRNDQSVALAQMDLSSLLKHCVIESERFYRGQPHDTCYSYELFRRALVERSELAWEVLYQHYSSLVEGWVRRSGAFISSGESSEYFVVGAFTKFWRAVTPDRFTSFPTLASLLHYLQLCATSVVIDSVRAQSWSEMLPEDAAVYDHGQPQHSPDEEAMDRVHSQEFWRFIDGQLNDESERIVVYSSFVLGLTPRAIFAEHGTRFSSVNDVYNVKRNVLGRLGRNVQLRQLVAS